MASWIGFVVVLLAAGAVLLAGAGYWMARMALRPPRMTDGKAAWVLKRLSPGDLGLRYEEQWFTVRDEQTGRPLRLAAWWIPHPNSQGRCVVLIHGYADAKVGAIAWAPLLHSLGWNILAVDLRGHGESEGKYVTAGYWERHDINQVIDQLRTQRPGETRRVVLMGLSLGAGVALAAGVERSDLAGMILDSPAANEQHAMLAQFELMGMPGRWVQRLAMRMAHWLSGADWSEVRPVELIPRIACPLLVIQPDLDPYVTAEDAAALEQAAAARGSGTVFWRVENCGHLMGIYAEPEEYRRRVERFLGVDVER
jgi:pimeloyl-ACP methyl ester carboxylesterase